MPNAGPPIESHAKGDVDLGKEQLNMETTRKNICDLLWESFHLSVSRPLLSGCQIWKKSVYLSEDGYMGMRSSEPRIARSKNEHVSHGSHGQYSARLNLLVR